MYVGGNQEGDLGNDTFAQEHVRGHGALGDLFYAKKRDIKMGDTPSVLYLLHGDPGDPTGAHWGGQYVPGDRPRHWTDDPGDANREGRYSGAKTVNRWRESYLRDWQRRMDWCGEPAG